MQMSEIGNGQTFTISVKNVCVSNKSVNKEVPFAENNVMFGIIVTGSKAPIQTWFVARPLRKKSVAEKCPNTPHKKIKITSDIRCLRRHRAITATEPSVRMAQVGHPRPRGT